MGFDVTTFILQPWSHKLEFGNQIQINQITSQYHTSIGIYLVRIPRKMRRQRILQIQSIRNIRSKLETGKKVNVLRKLDIIGKLFLDFGLTGKNLVHQIFSYLDCSSLQGFWFLIFITKHQPFPKFFTLKATCEFCNFSWYFETSFRAMYKEYFICLVYVIFFQNFEIGTVSVDT